MRFILPQVFALSDRRAGNRIRQLAEREAVVDGTLGAIRRGRAERTVLHPPAGSDVLILTKRGRVTQSDDRVVYASDPAALHRGLWLKHPLQRDAKTFRHAAEIEKVLQSWDGAFAFVEESEGRKGLRKPQIGAVHAVHAHWSSSEEPATVVMPTGTGKTDTMIAILVSALCRKVAVVVPTDALRTQIADKFTTLGVLKDPGSTVLKPQARYPLVAMLDHVPKSVKEVDEIFGRAQVIVMTSAIAGQSKEKVRKRMAHHCTHLFIDEAHHIEAPTWSAFKSHFRKRRILQFTATPFREDGKLLDGKIVFAYPLKKAQEEKYFKPIRFAPVHEFIAAKADEAIAQRAVAALRADRTKKHILMARVDSIDRARKVFAIYSRHPEFRPVELHTGVRSKRMREEARQQILSGRSRIVVCVDMLGEGFDLPELKIAAFHDIRKSLSVTLQLAGRFVRHRPDLGNATFIANVADVDVQAELRKLYTRDPDWNALLPELSEQLVGAQMSVQQFLASFTDFPDHFPLRAVRPAMSTVVYKTACRQWTPENFRRGIPNIFECEQVHHTTSEREKTLVVVTARRVPLPWMESESVYNWSWELYVVFWWKEKNLLFVNGSTNAGEYQKLARAVAGNDVTLIEDRDVFRAFAGINRLRLQNVGLTELLKRTVRYTGRMGSDVKAGLTDVTLRGARKSVLAGSGFENGDKASIGASRRGRIWSHRRQAVDGLVAWCRRVGRKLLDSRINPDEILGGTLSAEVITSRPKLMPLYADWPEEIYKSLEGEWWITFGGKSWHLSELSLDLAERDLDGPLAVVIRSDSDAVEVELELSAAPPDYAFTICDGREVTLRRGKKTEEVPLAEFFSERPPMIWFIDGSVLEGNQLVRLKARRRPYSLRKIVAWKWRDTNLKRESQGPEKDPQTVQYRVIRELLKNKKRYRLIFDDDDAGELADVVAVRVIGSGSSPQKIEVELYHCKFSGKETAGARVKDLYEVCGQAQKCISWMASVERQTDIFTHLLRREAMRLDKKLSSRIEHGTNDDLLALQAMSRLHPVELKIFIVQPGLSRKAATRETLELLSVTENHLRETYQLPFTVISSE